MPGKNYWVYNIHAHKHTPHPHAGKPQILQVRSPLQQNASYPDMMEQEGAKTTHIILGNLKLF